MKRFLLATLFAALSAASAPEYSIQAIRLANSPGDSVADLVIGAPKDKKIDTVYALWLIRGGGRNHRSAVPGVSCFVESAESNLLKPLYM